MQIYQVNEELQTDSYTGSVIQADAGIYQKKRRKPEDYVFQNKKGGAFCSSTFRERMKKLCKTYQIGDGTLYIPGTWVSAYISYRIL